VLTGELDQVLYKPDAWFGFDIPQSCPEVPDQILNPATSWEDQEAYKSTVQGLVKQFTSNMNKYQDSTPEEVLQAGPITREV
jgi:phosphoenolpyruvate carboxykinase (ATP)